MLKRLGQSLALVAMMASVLNAQCAVSCSLKSTTQSPSSEPSGIDLDQTQHSCCPHHGAPTPKERKHEVPCPPPLPAASKDRAEHAIAISDSPVALIAVDFSHQYRRLTTDTFSVPLSPPDWLGLSQFSSIFVLKI